MPGISGVSRFPEARAGRQPPRAAPSQGQDSQCHPHAWETSWRPTAENPHRSRPPFQPAACATLRSARGSAGPEGAPPPTPLPPPCLQEMKWLLCSLLFCNLSGFQCEEPLLCGEKIAPTSGEASMRVRNHFNGMFPGGGDSVCTGPVEIICNLHLLTKDKCL